MARSLLTSISFLLIAVANGQVWCPPGAEWIYKPDAFFPATGYSRAYYAGDTLLAGVDGKVLGSEGALLYMGDTSIIHFSNPVAMITASDDGIVSLWSDTEQSWDTMYWFSAGPGDRWHAPHAPVDTIMDNWIEVADTSTLVIDGVALRQLDIVQTCMGTINYSGTMTERFGWVYNMVPWESCQIVDGYFVFHCYSDVQINYGDSADCTTFLYIGGQFRSTPRLFPNPGTDQFTLQLSEPITYASLFLIDATGREVLRTAANGDRVDVNTAALSHGFFSYRLVDEDGTVLASGNWLKE